MAYRPTKGLVVNFDGNVFPRYPVAQYAVYLEQHKNGWRDCILFLYAPRKNAGLVRHYTNGKQNGRNTLLHAPLLISMDE